MSGPYRFPQDRDRVTSPLDQRPPNPFPSGQPPSFKTNINRNKTKKWVEAKGYSYDGDDWGDYDEDDEYGVAAHASQNPQAPTGLRQRGQSIGKGASRSFTEPVAPGASGHQRHPSFEYGEEKRAFSAGLNHSQTLPVQPPALDTAAAKAPVAAFETVASPPAITPADTSSQPPAPSHDPANSSQPEPVSAQSRASSTGWTPSVVSDSSAYQDPQHRRDFSESALPPPLQMRSSNISTPDTPNPRFPPRKSSLSQADAPPSPAGSSQATPIAPRQRTPSNPNKPLPFIRPADIYKRVQEERQKERASLDSERPSLDSLSRPAEDDLRSPGAGGRSSSDSLGRGRSPSMERLDGGRQNLAPLETVAERKSEYLPEFSLSQAEQAAKGTSGQPTSSQAAPASASGGLSQLPPVAPVSSFGADFWDSTDNTNTASSSAQDLAEANRVLPQPEVGPSQDTLQHQPSQGFRTAVRNAFERADDDSVPPTPVSKSNSLSAGGSGVSRSNTDSTAGISPIMSRVPSGAHPSSKKKEMGGSTPAIAEEPSGGSRPTSSGTGTQVQRKPSPAHSRDHSGSSIPRIGTPTGRRELRTPSPNRSPAKSPSIEPAKPLPAGESGELGAVSPLDVAPTNFATREADLASSSSNPDSKRSSAGAQEKEAQASFLEHRRQSAVEASPERGSPISRAESPTKGRVRDLAGKFNVISDSRRNSTQSVSSLKSNKSGNNRFSRSPSPTKETSNERPQPEREASFRPKLPGTWESYTTAGVASPDKEKLEPSMGPVPERQESPPTKNNDALEESDIMPTTAKRPVDHKDAVDPVHDPMAALAAAGAAIGESIKSAVAPGTHSPAKSEPESWEGSYASDDDKPRIEEAKKDRAVGDVYLRPLQLDRTASSIASSSGAPTPPAKDEDAESPVKAPAPLRSSRSPSAQPPELDTRGATQQLPDDYSPGPATDDLETDKLTADIMKRLSTPSLVSSVHDLNRTMTPQPSTQQEAQGLPREYENYWAAGGEEQSGAGSGHATGPAQAGPASTIRAVKPEESEANAGAAASGRGFLAHKFSWEQQETGGNAAAQTQAAGAQAPAASKDAAPTAPNADSAHLAAEQDAGQPSIARAIAELPEAPERTAEGLHIVNPEPELSTSSASPVELEAPAAPNQPLDADAWRAQTQSADPPSSQPPLTATQQSSAAAAQHERIPLFREILALKSTDERIAKYNQTREQFASMDTGLRNWVSTTLANKPEHADLANLHRQPLPPIQSSSGGGGLVSSMRHKHNASITHLATGFRKTNQTAAGLDSGSAAHGSGSSPTGAGQQGGQKMQVKGKDLLKGAGVLGGKGMKEAKGFFAKGRSRFRGESKAQRNITPHDQPTSSNTTAPPPVPPKPETTTSTTTDAPSAAPDPQDDNARAAAENGHANGHKALLPLSAPEESAVSSSDVQTPITPLSPLDYPEKERDKAKKRFSFNRLRQRSKSGSRSRPTSIVFDDFQRSASPPPPLPTEFPAEFATELGAQSEAGKKTETVPVEEETQRKSAYVEQEETEKEDDDWPAKASDAKAPVETVDFGATAGVPEEQGTTPEKKSPFAEGKAPSALDTLRERLSEKISERNLRKPISRQISLVNSRASSRPVSSVGSSANQFVAPEEWESLPDPTSQPSSPVNRSFNHSPIPRSATPGRSFAERAQSPIVRTSSPGIITMPAPQFSDANQKGRWERLGVLPSPNIEPLSWLDEKEKRRSLAAEQRMERVIESVVRNSTPVSVRSKGSAGSMGRYMTDDAEVSPVSKSKSSRPCRRTMPIETTDCSDDEEMAAGAKSSAHSLGRHGSTTPSIKGHSTRQSVRTRGSRGSMASLLPIPLDEVARKSMAMDEHDAERQFDVSPIDLNDQAQRDEQLKQHTQKRDGERVVSPAPDVRAPTVPEEVEQPGEAEECKTERLASPIPSPARGSSPLQAITAAAASDTASRDAVSLPSREPSTDKRLPVPATGTREYQVSPMKPEFEVSQRRAAREPMEGGSRPFSYMEGQSTQEEALQQGYNRSAQRNQQRATRGHRVPSEGAPAQPDDGMQRGAPYARRGPPLGFQGPPPGQGPYPPRSFQSPPPGMVEYGAQRDPRRMPQNFQSPPPGLVEYGAPQGRWGPPPGVFQQPPPPQGGDGFNRQDFDPRSYTAEYQLPGIGPPDESALADMKSKRRSLLGTISGNRSSPPETGTPASKSTERVNERIHPQHIDQQLHRSFSYQSSAHEEQAMGRKQPGQEEQRNDQPDQETGPGHKRQRSRIFSPFKRGDSGGNQQEIAAAEVQRPEPTLGAPQVAASGTKKGRNVLQRNSSSGRLPEAAISDGKDKKKKRTSILGSLFGRSGSSKEEKQKEKEEKKLKKAESKGKLSKMHRGPVEQQAMVESRAAPYGSVPQPPASTPPLQGGPVQSAGSQHVQGDFHPGEPSHPPPAPGYPPDQEQPTLPSVFPRPEYAAPSQNQAVYGTSNGFVAQPPHRQPFRQRYYQSSPQQQPQRSLSHDHTPAQPPMPQQPRRFSEQMLPRSYDATPPPQQQFRAPSTTSSTPSDWGGSPGPRISPQVSAMSPPQPGQFSRQRSGGAEDDMTVSPITSRASSRGGDSSQGYFGPMGPPPQRGSPGPRRQSDPFERQRMWYQQQQAVQQQQQRRMGSIREATAAHQQPHTPPPPQGPPPPPQQQVPPQQMPPQQRMPQQRIPPQPGQQPRSHPYGGIPFQQQQRPFELSLPIENDDEDNDSTDGSATALDDKDIEKDQAAWAAAGGFREVLPRGYSPSPRPRQSPQPRGPGPTSHPQQLSSMPPPSAAAVITANAARLNAFPAPPGHLPSHPPPRQMQPQPPFPVTTAAPGGGGVAMMPPPQMHHQMQQMQQQQVLLHQQQQSQPVRQGIEPRWHEVGPDDDDEDADRQQDPMKRLREMEIVERKRREQAQRQMQKMEAEAHHAMEAQQDFYERVHPAYRPAAAGTGAAGGGGGDGAGSGVKRTSPKVPPGFEGQQDGQQQHPLQMDPAYAKEYGIAMPAASSAPPGSTGGAPGNGGAVLPTAGPRHSVDDSSDDDDDEDLYAEPTYRSKESGQAQAKALELAQREAERRRMEGQEKEVVSGPAATRKEQGPAEGAGEEDEDEAPVMHGASYPGMEWTPRWDGTIE